MQCDAARRPTLRTLTHLIKIVQVGDCWTYGMSDVIKSRGQRNPTRYDPKSYTLVHESDKFTCWWIIIYEIIIVLVLRDLILIRLILRSIKIFSKGVYCKLLSYKRRVKE